MITMSRPSKQAEVNRWPPKPVRTPNPVPTSYYTKPPPGDYFRVYATSPRSQPTGAFGSNMPAYYNEQNAEGFNALQEQHFADFWGWRTPHQQGGSMYLDLGKQTDVALLRLLNTHNREYADRGTKVLRIDALPNLASVPSSGLSDVKAFLDQRSDWREVGRLTLNPTFHHRFDVPEPEDGREYGLGPWTVHKLKTATATRFLKLTAESWYKNGGGLAVVEVWSGKPVPKYQIRNAPAGPTAPGLVASFFSWDGGINFNDATRWRPQLAHVIAKRPPVSRAVVPRVHFKGNIDDAPWQVEQTASHVLGPSATGTKTRLIKFSVAFTDVPTVVAGLHAKHYKATNDALTKEQDTMVGAFDVTVVAVTRKAFYVKVCSRRWAVIFFGWVFFFDFVRLTTRAPCGVYVRRAKRNRIDRPSRIILPLLFTSRSR